MGKRSAVDDYRLQGRGGKGVINMRVTERTGEVVAVLGVRDGQDVVVTTESGMILRTSVGDTRVIGRATQGVKLMDLDESDRVTSAAKLDEQNEAGEVEAGEARPEGAGDAGPDAP